MNEEQKGDKLVKMLCSHDKEFRALGLEICKQTFPGIYAALVGYSGYGEITTELIEMISAIQAVGPGSVVRYRGLVGSPEMVITDMIITRQSGTSTTNPINSYYVKVKCKYWNKSKQEFGVTEERLECFEQIPQLTMEQIEDKLKGEQL